MPRVGVGREGYEGTLRALTKAGRVSAWGVLSTTHSTPQQ